MKTKKTLSQKTAIVALMALVIAAGVMIYIIPPNALFKAVTSDHETQIKPGIELLIFAMLVIGIIFLCIFIKNSSSQKKNEKNAAEVIENVTLTALPKQTDHRTYGTHKKQKNRIQVEEMV